MQASLIELLAALLDDEDSQIRNAACFAIANLCANPANHEEILDAHCLGPLIGFAASPDPQAQLRGVQALRGLSTDAELRVQIVQRGALEPLLALTKSTDVEVQMEVLACLCNLSLCGCIGDQPKKFMDALGCGNVDIFLMFRGYDLQIVCCGHVG